MTAFAGIFSHEIQPQHAGDRQRMVTSMRHDFASISGEYDFTETGTLAGWVRPSDSPVPAPVWNAERTVCLIFLGEEFSVSRDMAPATSSGEHSVAVALLEGYLRDGADFLIRLNGQFCALLIDERRRTATLFNDRYGLGRVYVHENGSAVYFATQAKALLAALPETRRLDQRGLAEYVRLGCVLQNRTLFTDVNLLPPGSIWTFHRNGLVVKGRYFDPATWEQQELLPAQEYLEQLRQVFGRATRRHLRDTPCIGMSLTGGLDSRAVIAWANAEPGTLPCYTFGGPIRDCADVQIARRLARICQHPHTTIRIGQRFFADFAELAEQAVHVSDGTMDVSGAVELHVNRFASGIAPVRLTGNYGSEILRSHIALRPSRVDPGWFTPDFAGRLEEAAQTYEKEVRCHRLTFIAFKQMPWHHYARRTLECAELTPRSPFLDNELVALAYRAPVELSTSALPMLHLIASGNPALASVSTDRTLRHGAPVALSQMASKWTEFTVKAEYAYDYGMPQWLARADHMLTRLHLERLFLGRHKFYHFRLWYRDQLSTYVREHAIESQIGGECFRPGIVRGLAEAHVSGCANHTLALHKALSIQLIEELFVHQR